MLLTVISCVGGLP